MPLLHGACTLSKPLMTWELFQQLFSSHRPCEDAPLGRHDQDVSCAGVVCLHYFLKGGVASFKAYSSTIVTYGVFGEALTGCMRESAGMEGAAWLQESCGSCNWTRQGPRANGSSPLWQAQPPPLDSITAASCTPSPPTALRLTG